MNAARGRGRSVGAVAALAFIAGAWSNATPAEAVEMPLNTVSPAAAKCPDCATVRSVREVRRTRSTPIGSTAYDERYYRGPYQTGYVAPTLVGPTVGLAFGEGSSPKPQVGARGTGRYLESLDDEDLEVTIQNVDGSFSRHEEPVSSRLKPGDRVRVIDGRLERP
jgi:hypothetical protein